MSILFFIGDSITAGAWDAQGGWAGRLMGQIMQETIKADFKESSFYCLPYNLGISGNTMADILPRLDSEIKNRLNQNSNEKIQIVYSAGINDSQFMVKENRPRFTDVEFKINLERLVELSKDMTENISFLGLLPVDDDLLNPIPWAPEKAYANEHVKRFERIIQNMCRSYNLPFLPLFDRWINTPDYKKYFIDGVHPNTEGHSILAKQIKDFLMTNDFFKFHSGLK